MLQLLIQKDPANWEVVTRRMEELMPIVLRIVAPPPDQVPEASGQDEMTAFAMNQYQRRMRVLERARGQSLAQLEDEVSDELTEEFFAGA